MHIVYKGALALIGSAISYGLFKKCWDRLAATVFYDINEVLFTNSGSACCIEKRSADCTNSHCKVKNVGRIVEIINAAQHSISLYMYMFTVRELSAAIIDAHKRGVYVRVIAENSMAYSTGSQMRFLADAGIVVRFLPNATTLMHHKVCLVDTVAKPATQKRCTGYKNAAAKTIKLPVQGVLMSGSMNWTMQALSGNWDNFIITSNRKLVKHFQDEFEQMWKIFNRADRF